MKDKEVDVQKRSMEPTLKEQKKIIVRKAQCQQLIFYIIYIVTYIQHIHTHEIMIESSFVCL